MRNLLEELEQYCHSDFYPFHMPGHKRNTKLMKMDNPYGIDITEIDGFDNLHLAEDILKELMVEAADAYGAKESFLLVNGSTAGLLTAISAATKHGDSILVARNCHRAVYHGIYLNELKPVYLYPQEIEEWGIAGEILSEDVDKKLNEHPEIKTVVITSPTYEGVVSDIKEIAKVVHAHDGVLIVDEAHGAHFGFDPAFPQNSIRLGADVVINSVHKTLPAFTQTALLSIQGDRISRDRIHRFSSIYQSSSPSYIMMAGIQNSIRMIQKEMKVRKQWIDLLEDFYESMKVLKHLKVRTADWKTNDCSKIIISTRGTNVSGAWLYDALRDRYHLQMEAEYIDYVIAMTSMADTKEGFDRLKMALLELDKEIEECVEYETGMTNNYAGNATKKTINKNTKGEAIDIGKNMCLANPIRMTPYEADLKEAVTIPVLKSAGKVSLEYAFLYPPGIPMIVPGEEITEELITTLLHYKKKGLSIKGLKDEELKKIEVVILSGGK